MIGKNDYCINHTEGCTWGKLSDWAEVNKISKSNRDLIVRYLGNYMTWEDEVYAVFRTEEDGQNYLVKLKY